jgi:hypothetical protein
LTVVRNGFGTTIAQSCNMAHCGDSKACQVPGGTGNLHCPLSNTSVPGF